MGDVVAFGLGSGHDNPDGSREAVYPLSNQNMPGYRLAEASIDESGYFLYIKWVKDENADTSVD